jgi:hypothetical protein
MKAADIRYDEVTKAQKGYCPNCHTLVYIRWVGFKKKQPCNYCEGPLCYLTFCSQCDKPIRTFRDTGDESLFTASNPHMN